MLAALASGTLSRDPQRRRSAKGTDYATGLIRVPVEGGEALLVSVIAFAEPAVEELLALKQGDALSVAGRASLRTWERDGEKRTGLSITADQVMTVYAAGQKRKAASTDNDERSAKR